MKFNLLRNSFSDTPTSSFETPIIAGRDTPKTVKDDKLETDEFLSKRSHAADEDDDDFDKQSTVSKSGKHSKYFCFI